MLPQPTLDPHGWYAPGLDFPYVSPNTFAVVLNYRHGKFAITPAMSLSRARPTERRPTLSASIRERATLIKGPAASQRASR